MANTTVTVSPNSIGLPAPDTRAVHVVQGDTLTIEASDCDPTIFFSPGVTAVLSPAPDPSMDMSDGDSLTFTFTTSAPGAYEIDVGQGGMMHPGDFSTFHSNAVVFRIHLQRVRSGQNVTLQGSN
jgi:hypothetical protein